MAAGGRARPVRESAGLRKLRAEVRELRRGSEILKAGGNHINYVTPAHPAGMQPGPRLDRAGGGDHHAIYNTANPGCCLACPGAAAHRCPRLAPLVRARAPDGGRALVVEAVVGEVGARAMPTWLTWVASMFESRRGEIKCPSR
jgi:hypothetical protein